MNKIKKKKNGVYVGTMSVVSDDQRRSWHEKMMEISRRHKAAYVQQEKEQKLRAEHPSLQNAYEQYQEILKLVDNA